MAAGKTGRQVIGALYCYVVGHCWLRLSALYGGLGLDLPRRTVRVRSSQIAFGVNRERLLSPCNDGVRQAAGASRSGTANQR